MAEALYNTLVLAIDQSGLSIISPTSLEFEMIQKRFLDEFAGWIEVNALTAEEEESLIDQLHAFDAIDDLKLAI